MTAARALGTAPAPVVVWRRFALPRAGRSSRPQLTAATVNGRIVAIASAEDLTAGLVGYNIDGIVGYSPASAFELMRNVMLWRATATAPPAR